MKKALLIFSILFCTTTFAQLDHFPDQNSGEFAGAFGMTWIDDEPHYAFRITPDISFKNFGVGLDLNLEFDTSGKLRDENFKDFGDYLAIIRYLRYGLKHDPVYVKWGAIDHYTLGQGNIMYSYSNSPSVMDSRRRGLILDVDLDQVGFESIYTDFAHAGIFAVRGYVRPLMFTEMRDVPILSNLEVGVSFAGDFNKDAGITSGYYSATTDEFVTLNDEGNTTIYGLDVGLPIINSSITTIELYANYAKIANYGSGVATGILFDFNFVGLIAQAKFERRFNEGQYIPNYFNSLYEVERFTVDKENGTFTSKARRLSMITEQDNGFFGALGVDVLGLFDVVGSYEKLDKTPNSGILMLRSEVAPAEAPFVVRAGYDKINIEDNEDVFTLDERSHFYIEAGYKPYEYLLVSMLYHWTYTPLRDADDTIIGFEPQKRIEPRVTFLMPFEFGQ